MAAEEKQKRPWYKRLGTGITVLWVLFVIGSTYLTFFQHQQASIPESQLYAAVQRHEVIEATFDRKDNLLEVKLRGSPDVRYVSYKSSMEADLYRQLQTSGAKVSTQGPSWWVPTRELLMWAAIFLGTSIGLTYLLKLIDERQRGAIDPGDEERPAITLDDVKGNPEVVARAHELVEQMREPDGFDEMGARLPRNLKMHGPPGTGKTYLAKAIAGTVGAAFVKQSGPRLSSKWLGGSAEKIAKLYKRARRLAKKYGVCIVLIDEIDAIATRRRDGGSGADDERNAALAQLLNELDGLEGRDEGKEGIVFTIVATNRDDALDDAFARSGRFDVQMYVGAPDVAGRQEILELHAKRLPKLDDDVNFVDIAKQTIGYVGADLERLVNEAAHVARRRKAATVTTAHFCEAIEIIEMGPERSGHRMNDKERLTTAYHEAGHTLVALLTPGADTPVRVTIVPRGQAGGATRTQPPEDQHYESVDECLAELRVLMAGLAAEKIGLGPARFTSGSSNDRRVATELAFKMVCWWSMGDHNTYIPLETWMSSPYADSVSRQVETLLDQAELEAIQLLCEHREALEAMVAELLKAETIDREQIRRYASSKRRPVDQLHGDEREQYDELVRSVRVTAVQALRSPVRVAA
jgi:cell division protease FtsH